MFTGVIKSFRSSAEGMRLMLGAGGKLVGGCVEEPKIFRISDADLKSWRSTCKTGPQKSPETSSPANLETRRPSSPIL